MSGPHLTRSLLMAVLLLACGHLSAQVPGETEDIRPPKALVEIPQPKKTPVGLWLGAGGGVVALIVAALLWKRHARRQKLKSPPEIALASLSELEKSRKQSPRKHLRTAPHKQLDNTSPTASAWPHRAARPRSFSGMSRPRRSLVRAITCAFS